MPRWTLTAAADSQPLVAPRPIPAQPSPAQRRSTTTTTITSTTTAATFAPRFAVLSLHRPPRTYLHH
ncbi:hypothetical protein E2C01_050913 [Portunus trituberculatus]|uniref:Uncharacterized protein n=1 Tax=Portunus trituberculatus TaxID=210409 RepID=A0A5B7GHL3_PORTR|nr:hypothetical protein [Portunus trituberculatus]